VWRAYFRLSVRRRGERRHHARDAQSARARLPLPPAFGDEVDDVAAALAPVVAGVPAAVDARGALLHLRGIERKPAAQMKRRCERAVHRLGEQATVRDIECERARAAVLGAGLHGAPEQQVLSSARVARLRAARIPAERERHRLDRVDARNPGAKFLSAQNIRSRKRTESERASCPRSTSTVGTAVAERARSVRSLASSRAPSAPSVRNAAAMIGLIVDPGIASWNTAAFCSASGR
jgi:hypothetical protein